MCKYLFTFAPSTSQNMKPTELIELFEDFVNETGQYKDFIAFIESKGYSEEEFDEVVQNNKR